MQTDLQIAEYLLQIQAVKINTQSPFTWSSGWKSPIYCDNRMVLSYPEIRTFIKNAFVSAIRTHFPEACAVAGVATAGIAHGALIADVMDCPYIYVRTSAKSHGMKNLIEGRVNPEKSYIIVEDLISTGGSSLKVAEALKEAGVKIAGVVAIFSYGFPEASEAFEQAGIKVIALSTLPSLLQKATEMEYIGQSQWETIQEWQKKPSVWGQ
ncbi:MAG: orotate phosphoribosyltransferase [Bacteroidia bacterium]|nr:orotate phosphoribosyltransferase [Bacteroidia bacterium]